MYNFSFFCSIRDYPLKIGMQKELDPKLTLS